MTPAFQFRQEAFLLTSVSSYILTLALNPKDFQISIIDPVNNLCLWLDEFALPETTSEQEYLAQIQEIVSKHPIAEKTFWKSIRLIVNNQSFTLVPTALFKKEYAARTLSLARGQVTSQETVQHTLHPTWEATNLFAFPTLFSDWILDIYPLEKIQVFHQSDLLLELSSKLKSTGLMIYVEKQAATLVYVNETKLHYCNRFVYRAASDLVYYVLFVMNELKIDAEEIPAWVFGVVTEEDDSYKGLYNHIKNLSLGLPDAVSIPRLPGDSPIFYHVATLLS
ncbi:DUF3822 family protein [Siphonobacter sp. SORGH_AS_0500]|uniref:DUF3822 family protein n=1 Tax=Siphonobacter sp. SORGH_AS_0500 TaxID=1864824 RepID=UPI00285B58B2|nr:DUF3822 family protein [Siphonobacter sp. SORGH_AS_0500]MDR6193805.1 hypothetical protein [Siphonobacter sp. SORGH_AS_0500]